MTDLTSFRAILDLWPSRAALGEDLGMDPGLISKWAQRDMIPSPHWAAVVAAARRRGFSGVTLEALALLDARKVDGSSACPEDVR